MKPFILISFLISLCISLNAQDTLPVLSKAPLFEALDAGGKSVSLMKLLQKGPVVISFYRGQWCPYCNRHMSNLQDSLPFITALGASLIAITPEKNTEISKTISKSGATFSIIYDEGHKIMDDYKVTFKVNGFKNLLHFDEGVNINKASGNDDNVLPVPATYIVAPDGRIIGRHFDADYTIRMPVKDILKVLESISIKK
jgi:peroxiredoxin